MLVEMVDGGYHAQPHVEDLILEKSLESRQEETRDDVLRVELQGYHTDYLPERRANLLRCVLSESVKDRQDGC